MSRNVTRDRIQGKRAIEKKDSVRFKNKLFF